MKYVSAFFSFLLIGSVRIYKITLSPFIGRYCRFTPTCSDYAIDAIRKQGPLKGFILSFWRILRCSPWGGYGYDPAPSTFTFKKYKDSEHEHCSHA